MTSNLNIDSERVAFEAWAREECRMPPDAAVNWNAVWTKAAWEGWQAARRTPAATESGESGELAKLREELDRIKRLAACGTVNSFLSLPDDDKRYWFAQCIDESERRKLAEERLAFLHSTNRDVEGWEYGVARVRWHDGEIEFLWALSDHSDIDAARALPHSMGKGEGNG